MYRDVLVISLTPLLRTCSGQGFPLSTGSSSSVHGSSQPKGVPFRPQDPEAKRALAGFSQPGRNFVNGSSAGKPYQGGGWDRGFNSERADSHDSRSSSSKQKPARIYPSFQQFSEPSFKKVTTFEQPHHHPRSTSRVSGMTVKGRSVLISVIAIAQTEAPQAPG